MIPPKDLSIAGRIGDMFFIYLARVLHIPHSKVNCMIEPLSLTKYRNVYELGNIDCATTEELKPTEEIIGQQRAVKALRFGLEIKDKGFNVFVAGMPGTGRKTAVNQFLEELAKTKPQAHDWVYVNNFGNQYEPIAIRLPAGNGNHFKEDMTSLIDEAKRVLPKAFQSEEYSLKVKDGIKSIDEKKAKIQAEINESAQKKGFFLQMSPAGLINIPVIGGKPISPEELGALPPEMQREIQKKNEEFQVDLRNAIRKMRELDTSGVEVIRDLNREVALYSIGDRVKDLKNKYSDVEEITVYLDAVQDDILNNLELFLGIVQQQQQQQQQQGQPQVQQWFMKDLAFRKYEVNVVVDNSGLEGAPVIFEQNPNYPNLFGKVEKEVQFGVMTTDFTMIRPGALHKANGGYIVIPVENLLRNPYAWDGLKNALNTAEVTIEEPGERMGFITARGLKPQPVPLSTKVLLIGTPQINQMLFGMDPDFKDLFKVRADFDISMERSDENATKYMSFICTLCEKFDLKHLDKGAVAKVMEYGSRLADDQKKLSTRFGLVGDLIKEANFYSTHENEQYTTAKHIKKAIEEKIYRSNLIQEKIQEYIERGIFLIETEGEKVGQVNGLSVMGLGDFSFGRPSRVTASIGLGRDGIVDIEREAQMGGPIHTKGVLILGGYLANKYAQDKPLSLNAKLVFEQSYGGIEGDSASSTELYAILSSLSGLPIKQSFAVTGSVNQQGEVQAIGGVNEKLEGYYEVCKAKGLTGNQGALIPASNVENLMLKEEILEAAEAGRFRIYPVGTIDEGIEILTGVAAGERRADGTYEEGTVNYLVEKRLKEMAERFRMYQLFT
jgi:lon-related putative ATP-dependent protease